MQGQRRISEFVNLYDNAVYDRHESKAGLEEANKDVLAEFTACADVRFAGMAIAFKEVCWSSRTQTNLLKV
eukprot:6188184-Pleurochrysis_carterae.AAC.1